MSSVIETVEWPRRSETTFGSLRQVEKVLGGVLLAFGLLALAFSVNYLARNFHGVVTREEVAAFFLPLILTVGFIPFLYALALFGSYQTMLAMTRFGLKENEPLYRFARREIWRACGLSLVRARLFERSYRGRLWGSATQEDILRIVAEFRQAVDRPIPSRPKPPKKSG